MAERVTNAQLYREIKKLEDAVSKNSQMLAELHEALYGDGEPEKGVLTRMLFIERFTAALTRLAWIVLGAWVTTGVGFVVVLLRLAATG